jgi:hypothetical protein
VSSTAQIKPKRTHLELTSGRYIDYLNPTQADMSIEDISLSLSNQCRWGGHCPRFYSIAEHACLVHDIMETWAGGSVVCGTRSTRWLLLAGLHHDDHEAFTCDLPTPLKNVFGQPYYDITDRLDEVIAPLVGLPVPEWFDNPLVKKADALALHLEAERFKPSQGRTWDGRPDVVELPEGVTWACGLSPAAARQAYLARHEALTRRS